MFIDEMPTRPNIVLFVVDDLGWADVGYHGGGFPTPNIDSLAQSGVILDGYYSNALCSPSRSELLTGKYSVCSLRLIDS